MANGPDHDHFAVAQGWATAGYLGGVLHVAGFDLEVAGQNLLLRGINLAVNPAPFSPQDHPTPANGITIHQLTFTAELGYPGVVPLE